MAFAIVLLAVQSGRVSFAATCGGGFFNALNRAA
jgi:hypothetical protein